MYYMEITLFMCKGEIMLINVNIEQVYQKGNTLNQKAESYDAIIKNMTNRMHEMQSIWQGEDNQIFIEKFDELVPRLNQMTEIIQNAASYLNTSAAQYEALQQDRIAKAQMLG